MPRASWGKCNSLPVNGCIDEHAGLVQHRSMTSQCRNAYGFQTISTRCSGAPAVQAKQGKFQKDRRLGDAIAAKKQLGDANRYEPLLTEGNGIKTRPMPIAVADRPQ